MKPLSAELQNGLAVFYVLVALLNVGFAAYYYAAARTCSRSSSGASSPASSCIHAGAYLRPCGLDLSSSCKSAVNSVFTGTKGATIYVSVSIVAFVILLTFASS